MKELKYLFETTVKKAIETIVKGKGEDGVETSKISKEVKPIKVAIIKPDRRLFKDAEIFYAKTLADYLKAGLLPYSLVAKRYANDGGPLTEAEKNRLMALREESIKLEGEFFSMIDANSEEEKKKKNDILIRINEITTEISGIQNSYSDIFDNTAEMKARNDTIEWWGLNLICINEDDAGYKRIFGEGSYEDKVKKLEEYEDMDNAFYNEVIKKLSYLISFWFTSRNNITNIDFGTMEKLYSEKISEYSVSDESVIKVEEPTKT